MGNKNTLNVRLNESLSRVVEAKVSRSGTYENVSEYIRDLIRRDQEATETKDLERLQAELALAFSAPDSSYEALTADDIIRRNQSK